MSLHIYPVPEGEAISSDFSVFANGVQVPVHEMYVSALPFNRRWPGHQRSETQRELAYFVSFATDSAVELSIQPNKSFCEAVVRPSSKKIVPQVAEGVIRFTIADTGGYTLELDGMHHALHIFADPIVDYAADRNSENTLYFGTGIHHAGVIRMKSNQTVFIDEGAVVFARIIAKKCHHIKILGRGILDNSTTHAEILYDPDEPGKGETAVANAIRNHTIRLEDCSDIEINGIIIRDSLVYNIAPYCCTDFTVDNIKIIGCWRYNSDGIDMQACSRCRISNSFIRTYDDSICVKGLDETYSGNNPELSEDIQIDHCVIWNDWGKCLEIGAEANAEIMHDITFRNCDIIHCSSAVLDAFNVDYADIHDIVYENIRVEYDPVIQRPQLQQTDETAFINDPNSTFLPTLLSTGVTKHHEYSHGADRRGRIHDITFKNIHVTAKSMPDSYFSGYNDDHRSSRIKIIDLYLNGAKISSLEDANVHILEFADTITIE